MTSIIAHQFEVRSDVPQPSYYTQIPNMAIYELDVYTFKLLAVLMDTARKTSKCWKTNKQLAKEVGCSVNKMKEARETLQQKGYLLYQPGTPYERAIITVCYTHIWTMNEAFRQNNVTSDATGVSSDEGGVSQHDRGVSSGDTLTKQEHINKTKEQSSSGSLKVLPSKAAPTEPMIDETDRREIKRPLEPKRTPAMETALRAYTDVFGLIKKSEGYRTLWVVHSLIDEHGIAKVQSAIQRCRGRVIHKPLAYIRSICQTDDRPAPRNSETPPPGTRYEYVVGEGQGSITDSASDGVRYPKREAV